MEIGKGLSNSVLIISWFSIKHRGGCKSECMKKEQRDVNSPRFSTVFGCLVSLLEQNKQVLNVQGSLADYLWTGKSSFGPITRLKISCHGSLTCLHHKKC